MKPLKKEKLTSLLSHLAAEFLARETGGDSLITVTNTVISENGKKVDILFTVFPEKKELSAIGFSNRHVGEFREFIKERARLGRLPAIEFKLDSGEKHRQKIDDLIHKNIESKSE